MAEEARHVRCQMSTIPPTGAPSDPWQKGQLAGQRYSFFVTLSTLDFRGFSMFQVDSFVVHTFLIYCITFAAENTCFIL